MFLKRALLVVLLALPLTAWAFAKPIRLLLPERNDVICADSVCVDDADRMREARALYDSAHSHVHNRLTPLKDRPLMVFCSTAACYRSFGSGAERAITYPKLGSLIAPSSWAPHFARHELIHALQAQELGAVRMMLGPVWFREGMAYSVSDSPSHDMPARFQVYRDQCESWAMGFAKVKLWSSASEL